MQPLLVSPVEEETLFMYLAVTYVVVSFLLYSIRYEKLCLFTI